MTDAATGASPWLARPDWAQGRIASSQALGLVAPWIFAIGASGITIAYLAGSGLFTRPANVIREPGSLVLLPFVLVSAGLLISAVRRTWRAVRSGSSTLELSSIPGVIGGTLQGLIRGGPVLHEGQGLRLVLRCIVFSWTKTSTGTLHGNSTCRWEDDRELQPAVLMADGTGTSTIPVHFDIPAGGLPTASHEGTPAQWRSVSWILEALGEPGSFWRGEYEVPVFRTGRSPAEKPAPTIEQFPALVRAGLQGEAFTETEAGRIERPPSSRIVVRSTGEGLEIAYPLRSAFVIATVWVLVTLPLYIAPLLLPSVPVAAAVIAGLLLNAVPAFLLLRPEPRRVIVGAREIVIRCGWSVFGSTRRFDLAEYDGVEATPQFFAVLRKNASVFKRRFFLATRLESHAESRWLASEVDKTVRRSSAAK